MRNQRVQRRDRSIKQRWGSNERHDLHRGFRREVDREVVPRQKSTWSRPKSGRGAKSTAGYAWKTEPRQPRHTKRPAAGPAQLGHGRRRQAKKQRAGASKEYAVSGKQRHAKQRAATQAQFGSSKAGHEKGMSSSKGKRGTSRKRKGKGKGEG